MGIYFGFIDEVEYLSGMVAVCARRQTNSASSPRNQFHRCCGTSTALQWARERKPESNHAGVFTGDWVMPVREAEASSSLVDQGVERAHGHTGSPRHRPVAERVHSRNGYQFNQSSLAPHVFSPARSGNWGNVYRPLRGNAARPEIGYRRQHPAARTGTLKDAFCRLSPFGPA